MADENTKRPSTASAPEEPFGYEDVVVVVSTGRLAYIDNDGDEDDEWTVVYGDPTVGTIMGDYESVSESDLRYATEEEKLAWGKTAETEFERFAASKDA